MTAIRILNFDIAPSAAAGIFSRGIMGSNRTTFDNADATPTFPGCCAARRIFAAWCAADPGSRLLN
jgi:hypothetical protein